MHGDRSGDYEAVYKHLIRPRIGFFSQQDCLRCLQTLLDTTTTTTTNGLSLGLHLLQLLLLLTLRLYALHTSSPTAASTITQQYILDKAPSVTEISPVESESISDLLKGLLQHSSSAADSDSSSSSSSTYAAHLHPLIYCLLQHILLQCTPTTPIAAADDSAAAISSAIAACVDCGGHYFAALYLLEAYRRHHRSISTQHNTEDPSAGISGLNNTSLYSYILSADITVCDALVEICKQERTATTLGDTLEDLLAYLRDRRRAVSLEIESSLAA